jgi:hypothetical protein
VRSAATDHAWFPDPIVGVWNVSVDITNCATGATIASREATALFAADGTRHETNATNPALRSPAFGNWRHSEVVPDDLRAETDPRRIESEESKRGIVEIGSSKLSTIVRCSRSARCRKLHVSIELGPLG